MGLWGYQGQVPSSRWGSGGGGRLGGRAGPLTEQTRIPEAPVLTSAFAYSCRDWIFKAAGMLGSRELGSLATRDGAGRRALRAAVTCLVFRCSVASRCICCVGLLWIDPGRTLCGKWGELPDIRVARDFAPARGSRVLGFLFSCGYGVTALGEGRALARGGGLRGRRRVCPAWAESSWIKGANRSR